VPNEPVRTFGPTGRGGRDSPSRSETLRGLLLSSDAWSTIGRIAGIAAIVAFVASAGAAARAALVVAVLVHLRHSKA
jgi:hypothetical protein